VERERIIASFRGLGICCLSRIDETIPVWEYEGRVRPFQVEIPHLSLTVCWITDINPEDNVGGIKLSECNGKVWLTRWTSAWTCEGSVSSCALNPFLGAVRERAMRFPPLVSIGSVDLVECCGGADSSAERLCLCNITQRSSITCVHM